MALVDSRSGCWPRRLARFQRTLAHRRWTDSWRPC